MKYVLAAIVMLSASTTMASTTISMGLDFTNYMTNPLPNGNNYVLVDLFDEPADVVSIAINDSYSTIEYSSDSEELCNPESPGTGIVYLYTVVNGELGALKGFAYVTDNHCAGNETLVFGVLN